jgi:hypothetical protein
MNRLLHPMMLLLIAVGALATSTASGQIPTYYVIRPEGLNMRQAALGDAACSEAYDVGGMFGNPASLNHLRETGVILTHVLDDASHAQTDQVTLAVLSGAMFALAVNATYTHGGELRPEGFLPVTIKEAGGDFALSMAIIPTLSIGAMGGVRKTEIASIPSTNEWGQAGMFYYPMPGIAYGIVYRIRTGSIYWFANGQNGLERESTMRQNVEIGATMNYPARSERPVVTLALSAEKYFPGVALYSTKGGLEVLPLPFLALRMGFKVGSVERVARYGVGIMVGPARLDAAIGPSRTDDQFAGLSLSLRL